ncbi:hypothetical protein GIB67_024210 [Kingdonia uniflora]|uniref:Uncharacterized protein n=1 Tax=Kingdonia uniflora TaxID=39325 RepID=A0A7J7LZJ5_9MAGN|nr:hypothetical protein GIB67_024210 [Kingdonia uniflora]
MEDSTAMTIEFLRARLLAERSISRTARQRADELAKRVVELEEQLKNVTLQRKKVEKATAHVLAILEGNGISDSPEACDSSSDQEDFVCESKVSNNSMNEEESSNTSKPGRNKLNDLSSLELQTSPSNGRSLSWKSCPDIPDFHEKKTPTYDLPRQRSFKFTDGSFTNQRMGKSCRKIKQMGSRSVAAESTVELDMLDSQENRVVIRSRNISNCHQEIPEIMKEDLRNEKERVLYEDSVVLSSLEDRKIQADDGYCLRENSRDKDMERALDHQAQLIGQHVAEEYAQREWEEKFREKKSYTSNSCEPGNQSDITEERHESKTRTAEPADTITFHRQERKLMSSQHVGPGRSHDEQFSSSVAAELQTGLSGVSFPDKDNPLPKLRLKKMHVSSESSSFPPHSFATSENHSTQGISHVGEIHDGRESSESRSELPVARHHETHNGLGGVLEALQRAKLSLKHELNRLPSPNEGGPVVRPLGSPVPSVEARDAFKIPVESDGLFRLPTNLQIGNTYSNYGSSLTRDYPSYQVGDAAGNPYSYSTNPNLQMGFEGSTHRPLIDPYVDMGMGVPVSTRPIYPSYADLIPRMYINNGLSRQYSRAESGLSAEDRYSGIYDNQVRPDVNNIW